MKAFDLSKIPPAIPPKVIIEEEVGRLKSSQIRRRIVELLTIMQDNTSTGKQNHDAGIVRGLLWALTGNFPSQKEIRSTQLILDAANIPYEIMEEDVVVIPSSWLVKHGLDP